VAGACRSKILSQASCRESKKVCRGVLPKQSNGICERFHKTLQDEFYSTAFRKTLYTSLEQLQAELDLWLEDYNHSRPHSGKYCG
jgi:hypothetical protein